MAVRGEGELEEYTRNLDAHPSSRVEIKKLSTILRSLNELGIYSQINSIEVYCGLSPKDS